MAAVRATIVRPKRQRTDGAGMIARVWHGWTTPEQADAYEALLKSEIFPGILAKNVAGFERIELFRRPIEDEVEFVTVMWFASLDAVRSFAGDAYETAYVPAQARAVLKRFDPRSQHYEVRTQQDASPHDR
jgi:heme-degrading monooxygenase HmoA